MALPLPVQTRLSPEPAAGTATAGLGRIAARARAAQTAWAAWTPARRLAVVRSLRHAIAQSAPALVQATAGERPTAEVLTAEVIPLADACRFLEREAESLLAPGPLDPASRPFWLRGVEIELRREPLGLILIIAPSNYPLFLPGVQTLQALTAGNAVLWKPGRGGAPAGRALAGLLATAGLPEGLLTILADSEQTAREAIAQHPDKVLLTGAAETGQAVLAQLSRHLIPATLELSGEDALFVLPGCRGEDLDRAAQAIRFGLTWNGGATCIAPRRVFVPGALRRDLEDRLARLADLPAKSLAPLTFHAIGAETADETDGFAAEALAAAATSPFALGASIFGPEPAALALAAQVRAGVVTVNDLIVPTADPRLPFGGRGKSGFGLTRGALGLLELTAVKAVVVRRGRWRPHFEPLQPGDEEIFHGYLAAAHGGSLSARLRGAVRLVRAIARRRRGVREKNQ
jgi:acyl-CoA reductase-like NAD-dependent aldehyde dehydrogenase